MTVISLGWLDLSFVTSFREGPQRTSIFAKMQNLKKYLLTLFIIPAQQLPESRENSSGFFCQNLRNLLFFALFYFLTYMVLYKCKV